VNAQLRLGPTIVSVVTLTVLDPAVARRGAAATVSRLGLT
jgi:hypothetical protein